MDAGVEVGLIEQVAVWIRDRAKARDGEFLQFKWTSNWAGVFGTWLSCEHSRAARVELTELASRHRSITSHIGEKFCFKSEH